MAATAAGARRDAEGEALQAHVQRAADGAEQAGGRALAKPALGRPREGGRDQVRQPRTPEVSSTIRRFRFQGIRL